MARREVLPVVTFTKQLLKLVIGYALTAARRPHTGLLEGTSNPPRGSSVKGVQITCEQTEQLTHRCKLGEQDLAELILAGGGARSARVIAPQPPDGPRCR
jgi:hypothetical protein